MDFRPGVSACQIVPIQIDPKTWTRLAVCSYSVRASHVYFVSIAGESMQGAGIFEGDLVVVDRALEPAHGHVVVALLNNEPMCKRLCVRGREVILLSENPKYPPRYVLEGDELVIWGVITYSVRSHA